MPLDPEALKDVRLVLGAGEEFERDDDDPRHDRADREDDSERDAVRGEEHREAEDDEGERQDRGVQARLQLRREVVGEKQADDEDTDGHRQRRRGDDGVDVHARDVLERLRHDVQTTTDGREHRPDKEVWLYPNPNERLRRRCSTAPKLGMKYAHQNPNAAAADGDEHGARPVDTLALGALDALQRQDVPVTISPIVMIVSWPRRSTM